MIRRNILIAAASALAIATGVISAAPSFTGSAPLVSAARAYDLTNQSRPMMTARYRAVAILKAKSGQEEALLRFTLDVAPRIRAVEGLEKLEVNRAVGDPGRLVLYYWWASPGHSNRYVNGPLFAEIMPVLKELIAEHLLVMSENLDG